MQNQSDIIKLTMTYVMFSIAWIGISDYFIHLLSHHSNLPHLFVSWGKGIAFVILSALLFYKLLSSYMARLTIKKAQLEQESTKFKEIFDHTHDFILFAKYSSSGVPEKIEEVNPAFCKALGYEREELLNLSPNDLLDPSDWAKITHRNINFQDSNTLSSVITLLTKEQQKVMVDSKSHFFHLGNKPAGVTVMRDMTELLQHEKELKLKQQQFECLFDKNPDAIYTLDKTGRFLMANPATSQITQFSHHELTNMTFIPLIAPDQLDKTLTHFHSALQGNTEQFEIEIIGKANIKKLLEIMVVPVNQEGQIEYLIGMAKDITERRKNEERIKQLAYYDDLTGLPNGRAMKEKINQRIHANQTDSGQSFAIILLDINRFNHIHESLGFENGDEIIRKIAERLSFHEDFTPSRIGGDKFAVLTPLIGDLQEVEDWATKAILQCSSPISISDCDIHIDFNIGISVFPSDGLDAESLIQSATMAMKQSLEMGLPYRFYNLSLGMKTNELLRLENDLRKAIEREQLSVYYQPKINVNLGEIVGIEALVRWNHPVKGEISPATFIPLAEQTGLIVPLGNWVLHQACQQTRWWHEHGFSGLSISVNLSAKQFSHPNLVEIVSEVIKDTGIHPQYLELEITESMTMDTQHAIDVLNKLKDLGVKVSVDDFGTGYSSLNYLKRLPIDALKIDQSFIKDININMKNEAIAETIVHLAGKLELDVVAEGVETCEQLSSLTSIGCHIIQGYLFSPPIPSQDLENYLKTKPFYVNNNTTKEPSK